MSATKVLTINRFVEMMKKAFPVAKEITVFVNRYFIHQAKIDDAETYFTQPLGFIVGKTFISVDTMMKRLATSEDGMLISISKSLKNRMNDGLNGVSSGGGHQYWSLVIKCEEMKKGAEYEYYTRNLQYVTSKKIIDRIAPVQEFNDEDIDLGEEADEDKEIEPKDIKQFI